MLDQKDKCHSIGPGSSEDHDTLTQVSTLSALLNGVYDGEVTLRELLSHGDFGIGTFDHLDGEMVILDGQVYQVKYDGTVVRPDLSLTTPFAVVTSFDIDEHHQLVSGTTFDRFERDEDTLLPTRNIFHAIRITGTFAKMTCRSIPRQCKPYPSLEDVAKQESVFPFGDVEGTVVGFRCPPYVAGINLPGYHLHFISADKTAGGHVLDFMVSKAEVAVDYMPEFSMMLPQTDAFYASEMQHDQDADLGAIEREIPHDAQVVMHR